ncbi:hypothetical protein ACFVMC_25330 [Nocardia sp. NPDC127579]|uniref:hypothetical protein n=1 Tax=Nocardia sp. NPDC127579 TaxID=3345402 RepID=UPI0036418A15
MAETERGVQVRTGDGVLSSELTDAVLNAAVGGSGEADGLLLELERSSEAEGLLLERSGGRSIRAQLLPDRVYQLTYREDGGEFELFTSDSSLVRDILRAWADERPWWRERVAWSPVDPAIAELESMRQEMAGMLDGMSVLDALGDTMDDALARADELLEKDWDAEELGGKS